MTNNGGDVIIPIYGINLSTENIMKILPNGQEVKAKHYSWRLKQQAKEKRIKEEFQQEVQRILSTWTGKMKVCKECGDVLPLCTPFFPKNGNSFRARCGKANKNCDVTRYGGGGPQSIHSARMMDRVKRLHTLLNSTKRKAKIEDREYDLDINWLLHEESKGCAWTGKPFSYDYEKGVKNIMSPSMIGWIVQEDILKIIVKLFGCSLILD